PGGAPGGEVGAEAALRPRPEIIGQPEQRGRRLDEGEGGADERQTVAAVVRSQRQAPEQRVVQLARPVQESCEIATGRPVLEVELPLLDGEPGADGVDRHPYLAAEAGREREDDRTGGRR